MAEELKNKSDRKNHIFAVLAAFFCIGTAALFSGMTASAEIPWGEKVLRQQPDIGFKRGATVYQRITAGGYTLTLADEMPGISVRLTVTMEDGTEYFHELVKRRDYENVNEIDIDLEAFDNLLGAEGFSLGIEIWGRAYRRGYYAVIEGIPVLIADSFNMSRNGDDYIRDIDEDGENELICNVQWEDGVCQVLIYDYDGTQICKGDAEDLLDEPFKNYWGVGAIGCEFLEEENVVRIWFWKEALNGYEEKKYTIDLDKIEMRSYEPSFNAPACYIWE